MEKEGSSPQTFFSETFEMFLRQQRSNHYRKFAWQKSCFCVFMRSFLS